MAYVEGAELPDLIPLFPLPDVVFFPGVLLPLHIFEPRYRAMAQDLSRLERPLIGMVLLRGDWQKDYYGCPEIFPVGCAGRVIDLVRLPDGRYNLVLSGVSEFSILRERRERPYRQAEVRWRQVSGEALSETERAELLQRGLTFLQKLPQPPTWTSHLRELSSAQLVNVLSFVLPLPVLEKQALLESSSLRERAQRLLEAMEFHALEQKLWPPVSGSTETH